MVPGQEANGNDSGKYICLNICFLELMEKFRRYLKMSLNYPS